MNKLIGKVNKRVIQLLGLNYKEELPIILGDSNIEHMKRQHPLDYEKYGKDIKNIIDQLRNKAVMLVKSSFAVLFL